MMSYSDPALPQLPTVLDVTTMQGVLQAALNSTATVRITDCTIERVKYRPGKSCLIAYRLQVVQSPAALHEQRVYAQVYPPGDSLAPFHAAQHNPMTPPRFWLPLLHLPALGLVLWVFPNDRKLTALATLTDPLTLQHELLPPLIAPYWGVAWQIHAVTAQVAQYFPEHNCMLRIVAQLTQPGVARQQSAVLYAKTYYNQAGAETDRLMRVLWDSKARRAGRLVLAQPLAYDATRKTLWQRGVNGATLLAYETHPALFVHYLAQAARVVATLHQMPVQASRQLTRTAWVDKLQAMRPVLADIWPEEQARVNALLDRLLQAETTIGAEPVALLHGDLHLQNFLVADGKITLIDLDDLALGSPWQEVGSFLASLYYRSLRNGTPLAMAASLLATFRQHYLAHAPWSPPGATLGWYTATALINERIARLLSRLTKGDRAEVIQLFAWAETISLNW